ncbi:UNVERIFIED_CONTAM: hypothetical protein K2H54_055645 [Gekko kuhli]
MELNPSPKSHCCQQLSDMLEIFSKGALLTSQTLALLLDRIKVMDAESGLQQLSSTAESPTQIDPNCGNVELRTGSRMTSGNNIYCGMRDQPLHHGNRPPAEKEALGPFTLPPAGSDKPEARVGRSPLKYQPKANFEMDLDMRSHWIASIDLKAPTNNKSLAEELKEADYVLTPQYLASAQNGSFMDLEESSSLPSSLVYKKRGVVPACSRKNGLLFHAQEDPDGSLLTPTQVGGKLDNSIEDSLLLSFGTLPAQEQQDIIERLEFTKNSLLSLKRSSPLTPICGQISTENNSNAIQEGTKLDSSEQNSLELRPLQYSNNEVPKVVMSNAGVARARGNGSVLWTGNSPLTN